MQEIFQQANSHKTNLVNDTNGESQQSGLLENFEASPTNLPTLKLAVIQAASQSIKIWTDLRKDFGWISIAQANDKGCQPYQSV